MSRQITGLGARIVLEPAGGHVLGVRPSSVGIEVTSPEPLGCGEIVTINVQSSHGLARVSAIMSFLVRSLGQTQGAVSSADELGLKSVNDFLEAKCLREQEDRLSVSRGLSPARYAASSRPPVVRGLWRKSWRLRPFRSRAGRVGNGPARKGAAGVAR